MQLTWQLRAAKVSAARAMQSVPTVGSGLAKEAGVVAEKENMAPLVLHKAWEEPRLRALNELGARCGATASA